MRNRIAFCARQSQAVKRAARAALVFMTLCLWASAPMRGQEATPRLPEIRGAADTWLTASLREYLRWRRLLEADPVEARVTVEAAFRRASDDAHKQTIAGAGEACATVNTDSCGAILKARGMLVWRTLETVIDRERVDRALAVYFQRYESQPAAIGDFQRICEEISGRDLGWFFEYYLKGTRLPKITLRRIAGNAPNEVAGEILVDDAPPAFQVRVEMRLFTNTGVINHSVATKGPITPFTVTTTAPASRIALDPDLRILRRAP